MIKPRYKSKLRAIDNGTRYDVAGSIKRLARQIDKGQHGDIRDAIVIIREATARGGYRIGTYHFGTGDIATALCLVEGGKANIIS